MHGNLFHALGAICLALALAAGTTANADSQPNILFIFADDQAYDTLGPHDDPMVQTPALDRLTSQGAQFTHCFNMGSWTGAVCVASRTMLVAGKSLWNAHAVNRDMRNLKNLDDEARQRFLDSLWPRRMQTLGYDTYFTGKWHVGVRPQDLFNQVVNVRPGMPRDKRPAGYNRPIKGQPDTWDPVDPKFGGFWQGGKHWSEVLADDAVNFLKDAGKKAQEPDAKPFFMYLAFNAPHDPRQSPQSFLDRYPLKEIKLPRPFLPQYPHVTSGLHPQLRDEALAVYPRTKFAVKTHRKEYYAIISHLDQQVDRILKELEAQGLRENTWIFYTADHGLAVGHHGLLGKQNMYDHSLRVPFLVAGPGVKAGLQLENPIYLQDLMATSLELAGDRQREGVEFESLLPHLSRQTSTSDREAVYGAYQNTQRAIRKEGWKLILYPELKVKRLYHYAADPQEKRDLAAQPKHQDRLKDLFADLVGLQKEYHDTLDLKAAYPELVRN